MARIATKALNSIYYKARLECAERNKDMRSRESTSQYLSMDCTKLARIELGNITPRADEVLQISSVYNAPELINYYCKNQCSIGIRYAQNLELKSLDRLTIEILATRNDFEKMTEILLDISEKGSVEEYEKDDFKKYVLDTLKQISKLAQETDLWAKKNI
ncbi:XRE family transcriptional regulator [Clostridioides sp. GD02404]|uniref:XRE family transcriptional regulator n=1 Tax=Clostridioides sp. GD02404 TaxID=3054354 RepID=UPI001FAC28C7|nr:XRE family transcriptional regulator [Clostridioides difficile]